MMPNLHLPILASGRQVYDLSLAVDALAERVISINAKANIILGDLNGHGATNDDHSLAINRIENKLDLLFAQLGLITSDLQAVAQQETMIMTDLSDVKALADQELAKVRAEGDLFVAVSSVIGSKDAKIADLQARLDAALAKPSLDPMEVQALSDELKAINDAQDANTAAGAAILGTPANTPAIANVPFDVVNAVEALPPVVADTSMPVETPVPEATVSPPDAPVAVDGGSVAEAPIPDLVVAPINDGSAPVDTSGSGGTDGSSV